MNPGNKNNEIFGFSCFSTHPIVGVSIVGVFTNDDWSLITTEIKNMDKFLKN